MTPEQIAVEIQYAQDIDGANPRGVFLALADLAVSMLRMIDSRRESGIQFYGSYNEDMLRIAVEPLAAQKFPPGPPMKLLSRNQERPLGDVQQVSDDGKRGKVMGDSLHSQDDFRPRYDEPAPLGGSFVLSCANAPEPTTGPHPVVQFDPSDPSADQSWPEPQRGPRDQRRKMLRATTSLCETILLLIAESLKVPTRADWRRYWNENLCEYDEMTHSVVRLANRLGLREKMKEREMMAGGQLYERFPEARGELDFIRSVVDDAYDEARHFKSHPVAPEKSAADLEAHGRFRFYGATFGMCMVTLNYVAQHGEVDVTKDVLDEIFERARSAALGLNHAIMEAASLRDSSEAEDGAVSPIIVPDSDLEDVEVAIRRYEGGGTAMA